MAIMTATRRKTSHWHYHVYSDELSVRFIRINETEKIRVTEMETPFLTPEKLTLLIKSLIDLTVLMDNKRLETITVESE